MMMNVAMCLTAIVLACCIVLSSGASLSGFELPEVKVAMQTPPLTPPQTPPKGIPEEFSKGGPPQYSDVEDEGERYRLAMRWCIKFHYLPFMEPTQVDEMSLDEMKRALVEPLIKFKQFYQLEPVDGELTHDVLVEMSSPRCADKDEKHEERRVKRWAKLGGTWKNMPVSVSFENYLSSFSKSQQEAIASHCANLWRGSSGLSFKMLGGYGGRGNIYIQFKYIDGAWNTVGQGLSPSPSRGSHLYLDNSETWKLNGRSSGYGVSLTWAMCHEMGHNLGLGHSSDRNAIMYPSGTGQDDSRLGSDDVSGIRSLYPGGSSYTPAAPRPTYRPTYRAPAPRTTYRAPAPRPTYRAPAPRPTYRAPAPRPTYRTYRPTYRPTYRTTYRTSRPYRFAPPGYSPRYRPTYSAKQLPPVSGSRFRR